MDGWTRGGEEIGFPVERRYSRPFRRGKRFENKCHLYDRFPKNPEKAGETSGKLHRSGKKKNRRDFEPRASIRTGIPDEQINEYVDEEDIDMIVMGIGGKLGFVKNLVDSVTDRIIRSAPVPVVTVRNQPDG